jgi:hypothetical protein
VFSGSIVPVFTSGVPGVNDPLRCGVTFGPRIPAILDIQYSIYI